MIAVELPDTLALVLLVAAGAVPVALVAAWIVRPRGRPAGLQLLVVAVTPVLVTWVGAAVAAKAMFISSHDLDAFVVIAFTAGVIGAGTAWLLGRRVERDIEALGELSRRIGAGDVPTEAPDVHVGELARLGQEMKEMSNELAHAHRREVALERSRRELIAWVSHDLRSPLAAIRAMAEAMEDGVVTDRADVERYLRTISLESERLASLVDDLFELSRISSGLLDLRPCPTAIDDLVASVLDGAEAAAIRQGVRLRADLGVAAGELVGHAEAERVVRNLVDNAVRHTAQGGDVTVVARIDGADAVFTVTDACGGIPDGDLDRVFDVAFRGDSARGRDPGGGGLGLAIAKGLVEVQHGSIDVANGAQGCRFTVRLPVLREAHEGH